MCPATYGSIASGSKRVSPAQLITVSTVAPTVLIAEIELQRTRKDSGRSPVLTSPWAAPPVTAVKR